MSEGSEVIVFSGQIDDKGHVRPDQANVTRGKLARWKGRRVTVSVRRYVKSKTNPQLAFFHGVVIPAWSDYTGYDPDEMKRELKRAWLVPQLVISRLTGEEIKELPSMADLNAEETSTFIERCLREGRMLGIEFGPEAVNFTTHPVDASVKDPKTPRRVHGN